MKHLCGHPKEGKTCKVCAAEQSRRNYERLQAGPPIWRDLATKPWQPTPHNSGESRG